MTSASATGWRTDTSCALGAGAARDKIAQAGLLSHSHPMVACRPTNPDFPRARDVPCLPTSGCTGARLRLSVASFPDVQDSPDEDSAAMQLPWVITVFSCAGDARWLGPGVIPPIVAARGPAPRHVTRRLVGVLSKREQEVLASMLRRLIVYNEA